MENIPDWGGSFAAAFSGMAARLIEYLPNLLGALGLLLAGWLVARALRGLAVRLTHLLDRLMLRLPRNRALPRPTSPDRSGQIVGSIVFWVVILFFVTAATHVLGLAVFTAWLNRVVEYLPTLFAGALILLAGFLVSIISRDLTIAATPTGVPQREMLGRIVQIAILVTAFVIGAEQIGINVTLLVVLAAVVVSTLLGGVALAVSLGARSFVSNLIGGHYLKLTYQPGQRVRIGAVEGKILEITPIAVVLESSEGRVTLPAKLFSDEPSILLIDSERHE
jgi:small-conductance mechanosensitive channel